MSIARVARPGAIYEESAAAQTFHEGEMIDSAVGNGDFPDNEEKEYPQKERKKERGRKELFWAHAMFPNFTSKPIECQYGEPFEENKKTDTSETHLAV